MNKLLSFILLFFIFASCKKIDIPNDIPTTLESSKTIMTTKSNSNIFDINVEIDEMLIRYLALDTTPPPSANLYTDLDADILLLSAMIQELEILYDLQMTMEELDSIQTVGQFKNLITYLASPRYITLQRSNIYTIPSVSKLPINLLINCLCTLKYKSQRSNEVTEVQNIISLATPFSNKEYDPITGNEIYSVSSSYSSSQGSHSSGIITWNGTISTSILDNGTTLSESINATFSSTLINNELGSLSASFQLGGGSTGGGSTGGGEQAIVNESIVFSFIKSSIYEITGQTAEYDSFFVEDLGMDELDCYELFQSIETEYNIEIKDEDRELIETVENLINYVIQNYHS